MKIKKIINNTPSVVIADPTSEFNLRMDAMYYNTLYINNEQKLLNSMIGVKNLGDIILKMNSPIGWEGIPSSSYLNYGEGVPLIRVQNINNLFLNRETLIGVREHIYNEQPAIQSEHGDIVITRVGDTIGKVCMIPDNIDKIAMGQNLTRIKADDSVIDNRYLMVFLSTRFCKLQMDQLAYGGAQPSLTNRNIRQLKVVVPDSKFQDYIRNKVIEAERLREESQKLKKESEDNIASFIKINLVNERINIIKSKFKWSKNIDISNRIDGQYYTNPIDEINKYMEELGVDLIKVKDIAMVGKGFSYSNNDQTLEIPYVRISDLEDLLIDFSKIIYVDSKIHEKNKKSQLTKYDLVLAITGATIGKVSAFCNDSIGKATLSADTAYIRFNRPEDSIAYLMYLKTNIGQLAIVQGITGATNKHLSLEHIKNIKIPVLDESTRSNIKNNILKSIENMYRSTKLVEECIRDVEDLIEGNFDISKLENSKIESRD